MIRRRASDIWSGFAPLQFWRHRTLNLDGERRQVSGQAVEQVPLDTVSGVVPDARSFSCVGAKFLQRRSHIDHGFYFGGCKPGERTQSSR